MSRVEHQYGVAPPLRLDVVEMPQLAGDRAGIEKIRTDGNHRIHVAGFDEFAANFGLAVAGAAGLRRHHEAGAAGGVEIAPEIGNPEVVSVRDFLVFVYAGK